jgi:benzoyl-CoA 2,3-dioxygenase component B
MITEEAHHMFVGETGVDRMVARSAELMKQDPNGDVRAQGGIDLPTIQKYINLWFTLSLDLFGGEISSNAAEFFASGLKGRYKEDQYDEHKALDGIYKMSVPKDGRVATEEVPLRNAMNEVLRDNYVEDCQRAIDKWNRTIAKQGVDFQLRLPSRRFHRYIGIYAGIPFDTDGNVIDKSEWDRRRDEWLPAAADREYVQRLMSPVHERGKIAHWIAPPSKGINGQPFDFEYVKRTA